jgi:16S rRNA (guanine966-N2)-methyltransferase
MNRGSDKSNTGRPAPRNTLRIIGGEWRGRRLSFPPLDAIRPTPDRVRETLFNWLQAITPGSRCLDLYAGSGALGFEALSRGAREVVFVDVEAAACRQLQLVLRDLGCDRGQVVHAEAERYLGRSAESHFVRSTERYPGRSTGSYPGRSSERHSGQPAEPFDVVFVDPPFRESAVPGICRRIEAGGWLKPGGYAYLEAASAEGAPGLPAGWSLLRSKRAGEVGYHLARRDEAEGE